MNERITELKHLYYTTSERPIWKMYEYCISLDRVYITKALESNKNKHTLKLIDAISCCLLRYLYETSSETKELESFPQDILDEIKFYDKDYIEKKEVCGINYMMHYDNTVSCYFEHRIFCIDMYSDELETEPKLIYGQNFIPELYYEYKLFCPETVALSCIRDKNVKLCYDFIDFIWKDEFRHVYRGSELDKMKEYCVAYLDNTAILHEFLDLRLTISNVIVSSDFKYICINSKIVDMRKYDFKDLFYIESYTGIVSGLHCFSFSTIDVDGSMYIDMVSCSVFILRESWSIDKVMLSKDKQVLREFALGGG